MLKNPHTHLFICDLTSEVASLLVRLGFANMESVHG